MHRGALSLKSLRTIDIEYEHVILLNEPRFFKVCAQDTVVPPKCLSIFHQGCLLSENETEITPLAKKSMLKTFYQSWMNRNKFKMALLLPP